MKGFHGPINMVDHTSTLGPIRKAHIVGSWVHLRAQVKKLARRIFDFMWHGSMDWWAIFVEKHPVQTRSV